MVKNFRAPYGHMARLITFGIEITCTTSLVCIVLDHLINNLNNFLSGEKVMTSKMPDRFKGRDAMWSQI